MLAIWVPQFFISTRLSWTWPMRFGASLAVFPVMELVAALVLGYADKYWTA